jgi:hypothetical protein
LAKIGVVIFPAHFCRYRQTRFGIAMNAREFVSSISEDKNEIEPRSLASKLAVSGRRIETGPRRAEDREGQTGRIPPKTGQVDRGCDR